MEPNVSALFDGRNFATLATLNPDGSPHASVVWVLRDGDTLLFSALDHRQKVRNIARDPRVSVTVHDAANPYVSAALRGTASLEPDPGKELPSALSRKYLGVEPPNESDDQARVVIRVTPTSVHHVALA